MKKIFGLPIYFLIIIILFKTIYLLVESSYNTIVLDSGVIKDFSEEIFNNLELLGHNITSIGVTLLLMPLCYLLIQKIFNKGEWFKFILTMLVSSVIYVSIFFSLTSLMDYIVEQNKDKRYSAYYLNILKNGIANNVLGHSSILKFEDNKEQEFSVDEKVIINNIFLLSYIDENKVVEKIATVGMDSFLKFYTQKKYEMEFKEQNENFIKFANGLKELYKNYNKVQKKANKKFIKAKNEAHTKYLDFKKESKNSFSKYQKKISDMNNNIEKNVKNLQKDNSFRIKWNDFVKYYNRGGIYRKRALKKYNSLMLQKFGRKIQPSAWCKSPGGILSPLVQITDGILGNIFRAFTGGGDSYSGCLNTYAITEIISENAHKRWKKKTNIPFEGLDSLNDYLLNKEVKNRIIADLRKKGIKVSNSFNYEEKEFRNAYMKNVTNKTYINVNNLYKKMGLAGIKYNLSFKKFVLSNQIREKFKLTLSKYNKKEQSKVLRLIAYQRTEKFYDDVYMPNLKEGLKKEFILTKKQLFSSYKDKGNKSIKALYIPPIAIALSLIFGVLNAISLFSLIICLMLVLIFKMNENKVNIIKRIMVLSLVIIVSILPFSIKGDNYFNNAQNILENNTSTLIKKYSEILTWIFIFEKYNYSLGVSLRNNLTEEQLKSYGLEKNKKEEVLVIKK